MKKDTGRKIVLWAAVLLLVAMAGQTMAAMKKGPYLIYPGNNTEMTVLWQLDAPESHELAWGQDDGLSDGSATPVMYGQNQYKYTITDLTPGVKYHYQVGEEVGSGTFYTAPADDDFNVKFLAYGDTRTYPATHDAVDAAMISTYTSDPDYQTFAILTGDWVSSNSESNWTSQFFGHSWSNSMEMRANLPISGCRGNHEGSATVYEKYWPYPYESGGMYWSFDYGPVHMIVIDQYNSYSTGSAQYNWLVNDLRNTTKEWIFIVLHQPGWSAAGSHGNEGGVQSYIQPLCVAYGVDIVFTGHNHYYSRALVNGVHHITTGGAGAGLNTPQSGQDSIVRYDKSNHFCKIDIQRNILDFVAVRQNSTVIESFRITHPSPDETPPTPDPMEWLVLPHATGRTSISMTARTASDPSGVEYYFECLTDPAHSSGWQSRSTYTDTGLTPDTEYTYQVFARDTSPAQNETFGSSVEAAITDPPDTSPPTPDPIVWLTSPHATGRTSISMTAVTASDPSGVEYYFECTSGGGNNSEWQSSSTYEDTGLTPGTEYTYQVKARDRDTSPDHNETGFSPPQSATTDPPDTAPPTPSPMTWATPPESTGVYSVLMTATVASDPGGEDPEGVEYYFKCTAGGGSDSDWQDSNVYEGRELSENTLYTYQVKARDKSPNQNETDLSGEMSARTDIDFPAPGDLNRDRVVDILDLALFGLHLGQSGCGVEDFWCDFADMDQSTDVDAADLSTFAYNWLEGLTFDLGFDTFDSYTDGTRVADLPDWYAGESSSEVQNIGVAGSKGFTSDPTVLTWSAVNGFNWSTLETGDTVILSMDFEFSDGLEDDAVGWIIGPDSTMLRDYFRVRLWRIGLLGDSYGIEGYWYKAESEAGYATVTIAEISDTLATGSWYRLRTEFTRLTATSVSIDAEVWLLDAAGAEMRKMAVGSIPDTSALGSDAPDPRFFENDVWPAFRNDTGSSDGACDNAYYGFMPTH